MLDDLRYAFRILLKNPGFAVVAILTMALGIGANTAVFSLINAILLRPLSGVTDPRSLVAFYRVLKTDAFDNMGYPDYVDYRDHNQSFSGIAAHCPAPITFNFHGVERIAGDLITENYFDVLGVKPAVGRLSLSREEPSAVISYSLWDRKFGRDPAIVGTRVLLNGLPFTIAGVAGREFRGTAVNEAYDVWAPLSDQPKLLPRLSAGILQDRAAGWIQVFGRMKSGVTLRQAQAEISALSSRQALTHPESMPVSLAGGFGMYPDDRSEVSGLLAILSSAVGLLLLIACANVAGLFLVRATGRTREIAIRLAVGASRGRIVRMLVTEGLTVGLLGGAIGLLLSQWAAAGIVSLTSGVPFLRAADSSVDGHVIGFTLLTSLIAGALFASAPALQSSNVELTGSLKSGLPGSGRRRNRMRSLLVAGQVALCFVLLSSSGILLRDLYHVLGSSPGFETKNAVILSIDATALNNSPEKGNEFFARVLERLESVPGVASASLASTVPPNDLSGRVSIFYPGQEPAQEALHAHEFELGLRVDQDTVAPGYFKTLGISIVEGREFGDRDRGVAILSRRLADRLWPGQNPVGKRISWPAWTGPAREPLEIIGVAADVKYRSLITEPPLLMYVSMRDNYDARARIVARTTSDPRAVVADVERAAREAAGDAPVYNVETMAEHTAASLWQQRMAANWIAAFSILAMILATVGLYSLIAQTVAQRIREVGIRMALGAKPQEVTRLIVGEGMRLTAFGMAAGIPAAFGFHRWLSSMILGVGRNDLANLVSIAIGLAAVLLLASWIPARRAARVDPIQALRCE